METDRQIKQKLNSIDSELRNIFESVSFSEAVDNHSDYYVFTVQNLKVDENINSEYKFVPSLEVSILRKTVLESNIAWMYKTGNKAFSVQERVSRSGKFISDIVDVVSNRRFDREHLVSYNESMVSIVTENSQSEEVIVVEDHTNYEFEVNESVKFLTSSYVSLEGIVLQRRLDENNGYVYYTIQTETDSYVIPDYDVYKNN